MTFEGAANMGCVMLASMSSRRTPGPIRRGANFYVRYRTPALSPISRGVWVPAQGRDDENNFQNSVFKQPRSSLRAKRSNPWSGKVRMDCVVATLLAMTTNTVLRSRSAERSKFHIISRPLKSEGAGKTGCPLHPRPVCIGRKHTVVTTGTPETSGLPCAMVLTVSFVISPVTGLCCHRHRAKLASRAT